MNLMLPSILRLAKYLASSSSTDNSADRFSKAVEIAALFSNSSLHLLSSRRLKVVILDSGGSKLGAWSDSRLHSCAYMELYLGSSRAFSNISKITPLKITFDPVPMMLRISVINFSNFSGVILLRIPRILRKTHCGVDPPGEVRLV